MSSTSELQELYQDIVLEHSKRPRNFQKLEHPTCSADGYNPLCGDHITVSLETKDGRVVDIGFEGAGCAISKASASVLGTLVKGKTLVEAEELFRTFHQLLTTDSPPGDVEKLGDLAAFAGVKAFPVRVKCATLAWHAVMAALKGQTEKVSTE